MYQSKLTSFFTFQGPEPYKPKTIPGKVALCPNCGGYSIHIDRCTNCKRIIKEGAKILPDPDYKPPPGEERKSPQDLRNIRVVKPRRKTNNDEPECIALSSDEEDTNDGEDVDNTSDSENRTNSEANASVSETGDNGDAKPEEGKSKF